MAKFDQIHPNVKKTYKCNQCGFSSNAPSMLKKHMRVHSGEKPFVCSQCNFSCTEAGSLKVHLRIHPGDKPCSCKQCHYSCTTASYLKRHVLTHSGEKALSCTQCTSSFTQSCLLKRHMSRQHSEEKHFICDQITIQVKNHSVATSVHLLSKRALTLNGIYQHIQGRSNSSVISATIHTTELVISREKPFVCKQCNFTCKHLSSLRTHMFLHTGEEPYACKKCNYSCKQSGHLSRHMEKFHTT